MKSNRRKLQGGCETEHECEAEVDIAVPVILSELVEEFLAKTRRLLVVGEINEVLSAHVCSYLQLFSLRPDPIYMYINSPGGCLSAGYAIVDQMLACGCPVYTIVRGQGHSMGAIIAAFGAKGHRYATPNSSLMLHSVIVNSPPGAIEQHNEMTEYFQADYRRKVTDLSRKIKLTTTQLLSLMKTTKWMSPKQAIKIGIIDSIWTPRMEKSINKGQKI